MRSVHLLYIWAMAVILFCASAGTAQVKKCEICHGKPDFKKVLESGRIKSLYVDEQILSGSVHGEKNCEACHVDVTEIPHGTDIKPVDCTNCHYEGNPVGAPDTKMYKEYRESAHGLAIQNGDPDAPICQDCHDGHNIRKHGDSSSLVSRTNVSRTCGACHLDEFADFQKSIHGKLLSEGNPDVPSCTGCHREHDIRAASDPASSVNASNIDVTCPVCHSAEGIMEKYGIKTEQVETYRESFHGVASKFGVRTVANCASCHGTHYILPPDDPNSMVHLANIPVTCGKCHPGANTNFAKGKIHIAPKNPSSGIIYYIGLFFKWLTISVLIFLAIHISLDLFRKVRNRTART